MIRAEEANGPHFDWAGMLEARTRTRQAVADIAAGIEVGMDEEAAQRVARSVLKAGGLLRGWHFDSLFILGADRLCVVRPAVGLGRPGLRAAWVERVGERRLWSA